jgi:hypothetical protein
MCKTGPVSLTTRSIFIYFVFPPDQNIHLPDQLTKCQFISEKNFY